MEALKKVYADIILNAAKEAAARAMESECKVIRIHHDLCNTKEEALRMLLRFKQMIDVKTTEAETEALSQQNRIKELDVQLNETEGVIIDLRSEIRNARERLDEMKNSRMLQSNEQSENKHIHQENTDITEHSRRSSQCSKSCNPAKEITSVPNLVSIIIGNNEPESYRNAYTHRIRALERNVVDEKNSEKCAMFPVDTENRDQTVITQRLPNSGRYAQSNHKLSRFGHENLNLKERSNRNDAKLTENNENSASALRRSVRKRKVRCWDETSSSFKSSASLSHNDGVKFEETRNETNAAKASDGIACDTDNRCLKYTFSRRRKNGLPSKSDSCSSHGESLLTGQVTDKPSFNHENNKPYNPIEASSSDSQTLTDIACQNAVDMQASNGERVVCV